MTSNGMRDAALALHVDMTMFASSRNVSEPIHNGNTSLLLFKTPNCKTTFNCRDFSKLYLDWRTSRRHLVHIITCRVPSPLYNTSSRRVWGKPTYSSRAPFRVYAASQSRQGLRRLNILDLGKQTFTWSGHRIYPEWCLIWFSCTLLWLHSCTCLYAKQ